MRRCILLVTLCLFVGHNVQAEDKLPVPQGPVNDKAGMLTTTQAAEISTLLAQWKKETTNEIVVLTVPSLAGKDISSLAIETAKNWKLGQKDKDNGVLFLIAKADRKAWITVGRGLEGDLTDVQCHRIVENIVKPKFRAGDYYGGIKESVMTISKIIHGEVVAGLEPNKPSF